MFLLLEEKEEEGEEEEGEEEKEEEEEAEEGYRLGSRPEQTAPPTIPSDHQQRHRCHISIME